MVNICLYLGIYSAQNVLVLHCYLRGGGDCTIVLLLSSGVAFDLFTAILRQKNINRHGVNPG